MLWKTLFWGLFASIETRQIDNGYPMLWSVWHDASYNDHTMAVCGYKYYSRYVGWWIFRHKQSKLFYELRDGHSRDPRYFDITDKVGICSIVTLNF